MFSQLVCIVIIFIACAARAEAPARTALHWTRGIGAERCIDGRTLARRVEELTGPLFVAPAEGERCLEGSITRTRRGYTARIVSVAPGGAQSGARQLSTKEPDCRALDAAHVTLQDEISGATRIDGIAVPQPDTVVVAYATSPTPANTGRFPRVSRVDF